MERDGNDDIEALVANAIVAHRLEQPASNRMTQMQLASVFELQHDEANDAAAAIGGNGGVEIEFAMSAIRAGKFSLDRA